jgi:ATP-dependent exoDNAse (exonuclease V) alpha subunit
MRASARDGVILVDEASLLGTRDMAKLFDHAQELNARVLLVGDRRQHRSVTAGEPLRLLEDRAGLPVAEVTDILRQSGDYKSAAMALSQGKTAEAFGQLDKLGWIKEVKDEDRNLQIAQAYLEASQETGNGKAKTALIVSPTHIEGDAITRAIREELQSRKLLTDSRVMVSWVSAQLTDAQKADGTNYQPGDLIAFHQNAKGYRKGTRLLLGEKVQAPTQFSSRFEAYRPVPRSLAVGDRIRITAGGKTKDGEHRLSTGSLHTVTGFTPGGDIQIDKKWTLDRDFGHWTHGYVATSHASQGATVDHVIVSISAQSIPATDRRTAYVAITRGKQQALVYTDNKNELLQAIQREENTPSALELLEQSTAPGTGTNLARQTALQRIRKRLKMNQAHHVAERNRSQERSHER